MTGSSPLGEADIRALVSSQVFERGYRYYHDGRVHSLALRDHILTASVEGSQYEPYRVQVVLDGGRVASAGCTCPYDRGACKHVVAALLALVHRPEAVVEKPRLEALLADLTGDQLRQLILRLAEDRPDFADQVEREAGWLPAAPPTGRAGGVVPVDLNAIRRQIHKDFRLATSHSPGGYDDDYYGDDYLELDADGILAPHLEQMAALLDAGDNQAALAVVTAVVQGWAEEVADLDEWVAENNETTLDEAALSLGAALAEVLLSLELAGPERQEWQKRVADWEDTIGDLEIVETALEHGWHYPPLVAALNGRITEKGAWTDETPDFADELSLARLRILDRQTRYQEYMNLAQTEGQFALYLNMLARTGQTATAVAEARQLLSYPLDALVLARILADKGETAAALEVAAHGLALPAGYELGQLAQWTREQAESAGDYPLALKAAQAAFDQSHLLADYQTVQRLAGDRWPAVRPSLLQSLAKSGDISRPVEIYLHEKMLDRAMTALDRAGLFAPDSVLLRVIEAARAAHPDWAIEKCRLRAEPIMDAGKAQSYDTAASWLRTARAIYHQHGRQAEWRAYLDALLDRHGRKYKLVPLLRALG